MTVLQSLDKLEISYIKFMEKNDYGDPGYVWWERIKQCQKLHTEHLDVRATDPMAELRKASK